MKLLIGIPSPRDIPNFIRHTDKLNEDKLWIKYYIQLEAYRVMRQEFLNKDYTHLCILPDDLLVLPKDLETLVSDIKKSDPPVISGMCNIDYRPEHKGLVNVCKDYLPEAVNHPQDFKWLTLDSEIVKSGKVTRVVYAGFPLTIIRRDIIESIPFTAVPGGCCVDVMFYRDCYHNNIETYLDPKVNLLHMRSDTSQIFDNIPDREGLVGIKESKIYYERKI